MSDSPSVVLIVEDDLNDQALLKHAFRKAAPRVDLRLARDTFQAEDYLTTRGNFSNQEANPLPSLILLDLKMPRKSGLEFLAWIREQPPFREIPVIVLSSSQESSDIDQAYALGARSFLVKSVDLMQLVQVAEGIGVYACLLPQNSGTPSSCSKRGP